MKKIVLVLSMLLLAMHLRAQYKKVGYMPSWSGDAAAIQYSKLTHINYSFAIPNYDGTLKPLENIAKLSSILNQARANGVKVLVAVGGWSYQGASLDPVFEGLASTPAGRSAFVNACINLVNQYGLDGIDLDWEYPDAGVSASNYASLVNELANALHSRGKLLTAAIPHAAYFGPGFSSSIFTQLDWVNLMAYDANDFQHATMPFAIDGLNYWCGTRGLARSKAVLGVPAYGRPSWESYASLLARGANPESDVFGNVGYNGLATIRQKSQYVKDNGYGGIMMWELSQDVSNQYSLISAIHTVLGSGSPPPLPQEPFSGVINLPGRIEAENFDKGGQQVAFNDVSSANEGGQYRTDAVDVEACAEGGYNVGWIAAGEWLEYTVNVNVAATYTLAARVASTSANNSFYLELSGQRVSGTFVVPNTGGWQNWTTVSFQAHLPAGQKVLRLVMAQGNFNLNYLQVSAINNNPNQAPVVSLTGPANGASILVGSSLSINANASDADGQVQRVEFWANGVKLGEDVSAPYSFTWTPTTAGTYSVSARAIDNAGATATSATHQITVSSVNSGCSVSAWNASAVYWQGNRVSLNGVVYEAKWWTQNQSPALFSGTWDVWKRIGPCSSKTLQDEEILSQQFESLMQASPNPTDGILNLRVDLAPGQHQFEVRNSLYDLMQERTVEGGWWESEVDLSPYSSGVYWLVWRSGSGTKYIKVVKQ
ncbi:MAG: glycosyl hydrolase family 18 protein [Cytophagaceae bacterium]|jgi:GH18 family chitinase/chitodextrinase|nr:glycosyl hydrolase family 18 protein [Cytophagaceae bacterium]